MYEIFEHTADFGIRARSGTVDGLFADAARGLFALMVANLDSARVLVDVSFHIQRDDREELFHDWLAELLYTFHARRLVLMEFDVRVAAGGLSATARGEPIDLQRHAIEVEVKAITWHALKIAETRDGWLAEVIVDV
jgi:SHS2 domain-containing protein